MFGENSDSDLDEHREKQSTREEVEVKLSTGEKLVLEHVSFIWDRIDDWTLFETVSGKQHWIQDQFLVYYVDSEGGN